MTAPILETIEKEEIDVETVEIATDSTEETPVTPEPSSDLTDEYNPDDDPEDGTQTNFGYGWGYEDSLDDPEELSSQPSDELDEDERYALGLDKDKK